MADPLRAAVFLDRDGVINEERVYVHRKDDFVLLPGVLEALSMLKGAGLALVVVTNQAGIARGLYTGQQFQELTEFMLKLLEASGVRPDAVYHCPHHPEGIVKELRRVCACRKPAAGMLLRAAQELRLDLRESFLVGDKSSDIEAGQMAGVRMSIQVRTGHPVSAAPPQRGFTVRTDLLAAARTICELRASPRQISHHA